MTVVALMRNSGGNRNSQGYWAVQNDGGVISSGGATFHGSMGGQGYTDFVGGSTWYDGNGYVLVRSNGNLYCFGTALPPGAIIPGAGNPPMSAACVGVYCSPTGQGYWVVGRDGSVFAYGPGYYGRITVSNCACLIPSANGAGYWMLTDAGGVTGFGSVGGVASFGAGSAIIHQGESAPDSSGFVTANAIGGTFPTGNMQFQGSFQSESIPSGGYFIMGCIASGTGGGYGLVDAGGHMYAFGDFINTGNV